MKGIPGAAAEEAVEAAVQPVVADDVAPEANGVAFNRRVTDEPQATATAKRQVPLRFLNIAVVALAAILAIMALNTLVRVTGANEDVALAHEEYQACSQAATDLQVASDYLTMEVRMYVTTGNERYLNGFVAEVEDTDRRGRAVEVLRGYAQTEGGSQALASLEEALRLSNELAETEVHAMRLVAEANGLTRLPDLVAAEQLSDYERALSPQDKRALAEGLVLGDEYRLAKEQISRNVDDCTSVLLETLEQNLALSSGRLDGYLARLQVITVLLVLLLAFVIVALRILVLSPLAAHARGILGGGRLEQRGAAELAPLVKAYNKMYDENRRNTLELQHRADHDSLTGLLNRGAYNAVLEQFPLDVALLLVDVDEFKGFNDSFGHEVGDAVLKKVAACLESAFRSTDYPCRIGGDEFAVVMTDIKPTARAVVAAKVDRVAAALRDTSDGVPAVSLSVGIAFSAPDMAGDALYRAADQALYVVKERGRNGYAFFGED